MKPTLKDSHPVHGETYSHPAFGAITVSRVSGHTRLHASDFVHHNYLMIRIYPSELRRSLSRDWNFSTAKPFIEIAMSEAQWATFVSSLNQGSGVPCTITWTRENGQFPPIIPIEKRAAQFKREYSETMQEAQKRLMDLMKKMVEKKIPKTMIHEVEMALGSLSSSAPFVEKQFAEHMENVIEAAKIETHAYVERTLMQAGLQLVKPQQDFLEHDDD